MLRRQQDDEGSALLIAVLTTGVCLSLALVGVAVAQGSSRSSGVDRQRLLALNAAEAGVDAAYADIQSGGTSPRCALGLANIKSGPDVAAYSTKIDYFATGSTTALPCALDASGDLRISGIPATAHIVTHATTNVLGGGGTSGQRTMEALLNLNPLNGTNLANAIFSNGALTFNNKTTITGNVGPDADVYTNTSYSCSNNENFAGSIYSQGGISLSNGCTVAGNIWAKTGISTSSAWNGSVAGFAKNSSGAIALTQGPGSVGGNLYSGGAITYGSCTVGKCYPNNDPGPPPAQPFPILRGDPGTLTKWATGQTGPPAVAAYTVVTDNLCATIATKIATVYSQTGVPTLVRTSCLVDLQSSIALRNDLAIFTDGGITTGKLTLSASATVPAASKPLKVHFVVPYDAATIPCTNIPMDTDKQFGFTSDIDLFVYSPCAITYRNSSTHIGQIYGGSSVSIFNQFTMAFRPVPVLGIDPTSLPTVSYVPSILYKRETVN